MLSIPFLIFYNVSMKDSARLQGFFSISKTVNFRVVQETLIMVDWKIKVDCLQEGPGHAREVTSMSIFSLGPNTYLRVFQRKPQKIPNLDRQAPPLIEFGTSCPPLLRA